MSIRRSDEGGSMHRRRFLSLAGGATVITVVAGCGGKGAKGGAGGVTDVRLGDTVAESNPEIAAEKFFDERLAVLSLPYAFTKEDDFTAALDGEFGKACTAILDKVDLTLLAYFRTGSRNVYNKKHPIRTPADLKGLRIRVPQDPVAVDAFNAFGAQATPLAATEVFSALQQGVIDGAENNPIFYVTSKQLEEAKFWSWTRHQFGVDALLVSKKWFAGLPQADQDAIVQAGKETQARERELWNSQTDDYVR